VLRWWQREAQRALVEHAQTVLPPTLMALQRAASGADRQVQASAASWARAVGEEQSDTPPGGRHWEPGVGAAPEAPADERADTGREQDPPLTPPADLSEHRRRLLVAGLTRVRSHP